MSMICVNGQDRPLATEAKGADLLVALGLAETPLVVEYNSTVLSREQFAKVSLQNGDRVELVSIVGGG